MGQKVNPHGLRVGVIKGWDTQWYADKKDFGAFLKEDYEIRKFIKDTYYASAISKIAIATRNSLPNPSPLNSKRERLSEDV